MKDYMTLSEIMHNCETGGYIGGEVFQNEHGQEIYFDGENIKNLEKVEQIADWEYVKYK